MTLPHSYPLLALVLGGLFAAGGTAGYYIGKNQTSGPTASGAGFESPAAISAQNRGSAAEWADAACGRLAGDLGLSPDQTGKIRPLLAHTSELVFLEHDRALLQMHLRILEAHDALAKDASLTAPQKKRLAQSRAKLKDSILSRFAAILRSDTGALPDL